jgi:1-phosphofructokinase family hexose kinase
MLVVGPNLSVDQTVGVPRLVVGSIHRVPAILRLAGGKGGNVARALRILGADPLLIGFAGGPAGAQLEAYLRDAGVAHHLVPTGGETRVCFSIADEATGEQTEFYEAGAPVTEDEVAALLAALAAHLDGRRWVVLTGSLPRGAPADLFARCSAIAHHAGAGVLLDARGPALAAGIAARPDLLKVNRGELSEYAGAPLDTPEQVAAAAAAAIAPHAGSAIITLGAQGAVAVSGADGARWLVAPPALRVVSPVGSGDAAAAGAALALEAGADLLDAARMAVAAGTANALHLGGSRFTPEEFRQALAGCTAQPLPLPPPRAEGGGA